MSAVSVLTPVLVNVAWPVITAAVAGALTSIGYNVVRPAARVKGTDDVKKSVELELKNASAVGEKLGEEEELVLENGPVTVSFKKDAEGKCKVCVSGRGKSDEELKALGTEISNRIVQTYVHQKITQELKKRGFTMKEEKLADGTIKLSVKKI
ncbi:MAG: hypothetical protein AB1349_06525 [Elusimicrobiota bacterium]